MGPAEEETTMSGDYKYEMQMLAEAAAEEEYGMDFYDLPEDVRHKVFSAAEETYFENRAHEADLMRDRMMDG